MYWVYTVTNVQHASRFGLTTECFIVCILHFKQAVISHHSSQMFSRQLQSKRSKSGPGGGLLVALSATSLGACGVGEEIPIMFLQYFTVLWREPRVSEDAMAGIFSE